MKLLAELLEGLPDDLAQQVFTHSSWSERRGASYERLAFLGDAVLSLAVSTHLYPRLDGEEYGAGDLTKIRAQVVSGRSCRSVADRLGLPERLRTAAPDSQRSTAESLVQVEHVVSDALEAVIAACYLHYGYERTAEAVTDAFAPEIEDAITNPVDAKSALQEHLAREGRTVDYRVLSEHGPPHDRTFDVAAHVEGREVGRGSGRSKKDAEQVAAEAALEGLGAE